MSFEQRVTTLLINIRDDLKVSRSMQSVIEKHFDEMLGVIRHRSDGRMNGVISLKVFCDLDDSLNYFAVRSAFNRTRVIRTKKLLANSNNQVFARPNALHVENRSDKNKEEGCLAAKTRVAQDHNSDVLRLNHLDDEGIVRLMASEQPIYRDDGYGQKNVAVLVSTPT